MIDYTETISNIHKFKTDSLTKKISKLESEFQGAELDKVSRLLTSEKIDRKLLRCALQIKEIAGEIHVLVHTLGILLALEDILQDGEIVEELSLGAGNTGRKYDLKTNYKVAEFKFINWRGSSEAIRQNSLFKDFYELAELDTHLEKHLYVIGCSIPLKFMSGNRSIKSVLSRNNKLWGEFQSKYQTRFTVVREYYEYKKDNVKIIDLKQVSRYFKDVMEVI